MQKWARKVLVVAGVLAVCAVSSTPAWALNTLKGKEAKEHIGDAKSHFVDKNYTFEILKRSHRDAMHGRFSDGVVFNPDGGLFAYPRRKDGEHKVVLDDPSGREEEPVTEEAWRKNLENALSDDNPQPTVFLDEQGKELAVAFIGTGTRIEAKMNDSGFLEISLEVEGGKANRGRRRGYM